MTTPNRGSDSVMSVAQQLVQYDDDDDIDERMEASHSKMLGIGREAELDGRRDGMDRVNLNVGGSRNPEAGSGYQGAVDGNGGGDFYQGDPLGLYGTYGTDGDGVSRDGAGASHGFPDLQDRVMEDTSMDANSSRINAEDPEAYLPEDSIKSEEHSSFSSIQQLQLRAQILVYGDLIKGILPEESLMSSAFSDEGCGPDQSPSGWNWERIWQVAAEREAERRDLEINEDDGQEDYDGQTERGTTLQIDQGVAVTTGPDTPSGSPFRTVEHFAVAMPQGPAGIMDASVTSAGGQAADGGDGHGMLSANLDTVVHSIVTGTANLVDGLGSNNAPEFRSARSPSLDPWLKPQLASHGFPAPGPVLEANSPSAQGVAAGQAEPANIMSSFPVTGTPDKQPLKKGRWGARRTTPTNVEEAVPAQEDDPSTQGLKNAKTPASNQRKGGRGRGRAQAQKAVETAGTPRRTRERKSSGAKDVTETITPADIEPEKVEKALAAKSPSRRGLRAKNVADANAVVDSVVTDSFQPGAEVSDGKLSPGNLPLGKEKELEDGSDLHSQTQTWLEQAKASFNEALAAANSAAEQKEHVELVTAQTNQTPGKDSNQSASVAAAVYAAASVAKAAAEAAKVAYHAALQAACIVADGYGDSGQLGGLGGSDKDGGLGGRKSAIAAAKEEARKRPVATSPSKTTPQSTDAVLRAARLMAEAASEAGAVLAKGNACTPPLTAPEKPLVDSADIKRGGRGGRGRLGKEAVSFSTPDADGNGSTVKRGKGTTGGKQSLKKGARRVAKELDAAPPQSDTPAEKVTGRQLVLIASSPSHAADVPEIVHQDQIVEGSLVEVMNDEEGLRGGWFTAKVLELKDRQVYVQYDEILTDDGSARLKELFPLDGPSEGTEAGRPRIRLISPKNIAREEGRRKRRRAATEQIIWSVGDRVDAYDKDGWWEGIIQDIDEDDETKVTLHFPAEQATSILKSWNLRPSLFWKDGRWEQWVRDGGFQYRLEDDPALKKSKAAQSPKAQARKPGRKLNTPAKTSDETKGISRASRRLKELGENVVASPAITTRSSPRQNIQKKDGRTKVAQETAEVETTPK